MQPAGGQTGRRVQQTDGPDALVDHEVDLGVPESHNVRSEKHARRWRTGRWTTDLLMQTTAAAQPLRSTRDGQILKRPVESAALLQRDEEGRGRQTAVDEMRASDRAPTSCGVVTARRKRSTHM